MKANKTFAKIVDEYEYARPNYPDSLFSDILSYSGINNKSLLLEIGAGTGQATSFFAENGFDLTALEISDKQIQFLENKFSKYNNVHLVKSEYENYNDDKKYDLIFAASSFHWIDKTIRCQKVYNMLKSDGTIALFWHMQPITKYTAPPFDKLNDIISHFFTEKHIYNSSELSLLHTRRMEELVSHSFNEVKFLEYKFNILYSGSRYVSLLNTFSYVQMFDYKDRHNFLSSVEACLQRYNDFLLVPDVVHLYLGKKANGME